MISADVTQPGLPTAGESTRCPDRTRGSGPIGRPRSAGASCRVRRSLYPCGCGVAQGRRLRTGNHTVSFRMLICWWCQFSLAVLNVDRRSRHCQQLSLCYQRFRVDILAGRTSDRGYSGILRDSLNDSPRARIAKIALLQSPLKWLPQLSAP